MKTPKVGLCTLLYETGETRLPRAHPLFQRRRMLEEVNALRIVRPGEQPKLLTRDERDAILLKLKDKKTVAFETLRTKVLKLDAVARFNKESENRKELKGDEIAAAMMDRIVYSQAVETLGYHHSDFRTGARQLTDTQHLSRLAREYVGALYPERGEGSSKVWVSPGRLTEMLRWPGG